MESKHLLVVLRTKVLVMWGQLRLSFSGNGPVGKTAGKGKSPTGKGARKNV